MSSYYNRDGSPVFRINAPNLEFAKQDGSIGKMDLGASVPFVASPRLPRRLAGYGDSFTARGFNYTAANTLEVSGYMFWASSLTGCSALSEDNFGVSGETSTQMTGRILDVVNSPAKIILFPSVTNDRGLGLTLAETKRNVLYILEVLGDAGKTVIVGTGTPRFDGMSAQATADAVAYKDWVLTYLREVTPVVNLWDGFTAADTYDNLHPNVAGAKKIGERFAEVIRFFNTSKCPLPMDDELFTGLSFSGSLIDNVQFRGTTGVINANANPVAGSQLATGYTAVGATITGLTSRWYKEASTFGEKQCVQLIRTTGAEGTLTVAPTAYVANHNYPGNLLVAMCEVDVVGAVSNLLGVHLQITVVKGGVTTRYVSGKPYGAGAFLPSGSSYVLETPMYEADGTETSLTVQIVITAGANVPQNCTVKVGRLALRRKNIP